MYASREDFEAAMEAWLKDGDGDFYDGEGNSTPGGLDDAGGHLNAERLADYIDQVHDEYKYRGES